MTLYNSIWSLLQSGLAVASNETGMKLWKENDYIIDDNGSITKFGLWEDAINYFFSCHIRTIQKNIE